jgi:branched-subunit amino acid ABC-type transport system permease component
MVSETDSPIYETLVASFGATTRRHCRRVQGDTVTVLFYSIGFGLVTASIIALASVAFSLQFSVTTTPNFAHGDLLTAGAYGAFAAQTLTHNLALEVISSIVVGGLVASFLNLALMQPFLRAGARRLTIFMVTVSFGWILQNVLLIFFGGAPSSFVLPTAQLEHVGPFLWTTTDIAIMSSSVVILAALHVVLQYTRFGKSLRAVSDNPELARVTGIPYPQVVRLTWLIDGMLAGFAGFVLASYVGTLTPTTGFSFLVVVFAASVLGGLGRPYGTAVGALIIGLAMEVSASYLPAEYKTSVAFVLLIGALLIRPRGIFATEIWNFAD